jgi:OOP family OmpA-OmpF porin
MKIKIAALLSLTLWIFGGLYFYTSVVKKNRTSKHRLVASNQLSTNETTVNELIVDSTSVVQTIDSLSNRNTFVPKTINTGFNLTDFTPDEDLKAYANQLHDFLMDNPNKILHIIGHTDSVGDDEVNQWLSEQRANSVKKYFTDLGIKQTQIIATAKGETEPIATNSTIEGRQKNRRIELLIK